MLQSMRSERGGHNLVTEQQGGCGVEISLDSFIVFLLYLKQNLNPQRSL